MMPMIVKAMGIATTSRGLRLLLLPVGITGCTRGGLRTEGLLEKFQATTEGNPAAVKIPIERR